MEYVAVVLLLIYLAPFTVAAGRDHPRARSILALNLALGWTGVGWLAALAWAWPARDRPSRPRLTLVTAEIDRDQDRPSAGRSGLEPLLGVVAAGLAAATVLGGPAAGLQAPWWPEAQSGVFAPHVERLGRSGAPLRRSAGAWAVRGSLPPGCDVWVVEHRNGWKRIWKTAGCRTRAPGPADGWIGAHRAHPRSLRQAPGGAR
jgi:hypothetical protein